MLESYSPMHYKVLSKYLDQMMRTSLYMYFPLSQNALQHITHYHKNVLC